MSSISFKPIICLPHSQKQVQVLGLRRSIALIRTWVGNLKQRVPITSKSSNFKGETQHYVVKLSKSAGAEQYCPKIPQVPGTRGTHTNSSPANRLFERRDGLLIFKLSKERRDNAEKDVADISIESLYAIKLGHSSLLNLPRSLLHMQDFDFEWIIIEWIEVPVILLVTHL